jgi:glycosyltransferase involved in cell wall biosynthesis
MRSSSVSVLVDGRSAVVPRTTGWERYVTGLVDALARCPQNVEIYSPRLTSSKLKLLRTDWVDLPYRARRHGLVHMPSFPPSPAVVRAAGGNVVWTLFDLTWWRMPEASSQLGQHYYHPMASRALDSLRMVVTPSEVVRREAADVLGMDVDRIQAIPPGFEPLPERGNAPATYGLERDYVLTVGTVEPRKNLGRLLAGYRRSRISRTHDLVAVGRQGWGGGVPGLRVLEGLTDAELGDVYRGAAAYVSASTYEGFGLPTLEAAHFGLPLIMSDIPIYREVLGDQAVFFDPLSDAGIAEALDRGLEEPCRMNRSLLDRYSWDAVAMKHLELYARLVGQ